MTADRTYRPEDVAIAVLNYNGLEIIPELFASIRRLSHPVGEVLMVDDGSTDTSCEWVRANYPEVRVIGMGENTGMLNRVRNRALAEAEHDLVLIADNDVVFAPDCVDRLVEVMNRSDRVGACMTRALYLEDPGRIYQDGHVLHYVGASPGPNRDAPVPEGDDPPRLGIGWGTQLLHRAIVTDAGGYNEAYFLGWGDDGELNHRLHLFGLECYHVPAAVVYHRREEASSRFKAAVANRLRFILEMYHWRTILLSLPAFAAYELSLVGFLVSKRSFGDYIRGVAHTLRRLGSVGRNRRRIQSRRTVRDREVMTSGDIFVYSSYIDSKFVRCGYRALNGFLNGYWRLIRRLV